MMSESNMTRPLALAFVLVSSGLPTGLAHATDWSNSPGVACVSTQSPSSSSLQADSTTYGAVRNTSTTSSITVICPIQRDSFGSGGFDGDMESEVWVVDDSSGGDISCSLCARDMEDLSSSLLCTSTVTESADGSSSFVLNLDDASLTTTAGDLAPGRGYYYYLKCSLPKSSGGYAKIIAYEIDEDDE